MRVPWVLRLLRARASSFFFRHSQLLLRSGFLARDSITAFAKVTQALFWIR